MTNTQTDKETDRRTDKLPTLYVKTSVAIARIYAVNACDAV